MVPISKTNTETAPARKRTIGEYRNNWPTALLQAANVDGMASPLAPRGSFAGLCRRGAVKMLSHRGTGLHRMRTNF